MKGINGSEQIIDQLGQIQSRKESEIEANSDPPKDLS